MSTTSEFPYQPQPGSLTPGTGGRDKPAAGGTIVSSLVILAGSVLLGLAGGLVWAALAPRALYVIVDRGSADVVNPETTAFIAADAWFCLIGLTGGVVIGLAGYLLAVRRYGPAPMAAILAGSIGAGIAARWVGEHQGLSQFDHRLLTGHHGALLHAPLGLAGDTSATVWPAASSLPALASWTLAACLVAGGIVLIGALRSRSSARPYAAPFPGPQQFSSYPGQ